MKPAVVGTIRGMDADAQTAWLATTEGIAFSKIAGNSFIGILSAIIGGKENIKTVDCCATRLRFELGDSALVDEAVYKKTGALGVMKMDKGTTQIIIGTQVQTVAEELKKLL